VQFLEQAKKDHKNPVYLRLLWIGQVSLKFEKQARFAIKDATEPFKLALCFQPRFYPQSTKIMCPPLDKVWLYINMYVAVTVGTWAKLS